MEGSDDARIEVPMKKMKHPRPRGKDSKALSSPPPTFPLTDGGNAERLAYYFAGRLRYVAAWGVFLVWTGTHWRRDVGGVLVGALAKRAINCITAEINATKKAARRDALREWQHGSQSRARREAMIALVKSEDGVAIDHEDLDRNPYLLNCRNGTIDLRTGKLNAHDPADLITRVIPIDYAAKAKAPRWRRFLAEVLPNGEVRSFMQRFTGYCATGEVSERMFLVLFGGGRNGKSVFLRIVQKALGPYAISSAPGLLMARQQDAHPTELADLFGVRVAVASEARKGRAFDEEQVKRLTGNDTLKARRMREDFWEFDPTHKLVLAANHKPRVRDASDSFWDRVALVAFTVRIGDNKLDRNLLDKLMTELPGILVWIVQGCVAWRKYGVGTPAAVKATTREYREAEDVIGRFLSECCTIEQKLRDLTPTTHLMTSARKWCESNNLYLFSDKDLAEALRERGCLYARTGAERGWRGIKVNTQ